MPKIDLVGRRFGSLVVIEEAELRQKHTIWRARCDCGNFREVWGRELRDGAITSCRGCWIKKRAHDPVPPLRTDYSAFGQGAILDNVEYDTVGGCWLWTKNLNGGYATILATTKPRQTLRASRVAWAVFNGGRVPDGMHVLHQCDNRACVNPDHLHLGTHADNMREMSQRTTPKAGQPRKRLTDAQKSEIARRAPFEGVKSIARSLGVSPATVRLWRDAASNGDRR